MPILPLTDIHRLIVRYLSEYFPLYNSELPDSAPINEHGVDSLGTTEIMVYIQEMFHIEIDDSDLTRANFGTVKGLVSYIHKKLNNTSPSH